MVYAGDWVNLEKQRIEFGGNCFILFTIGMGKQGGTAASFVYNRDGGTGEATWTAKWTASERPCCS
ncbi:MULTISPECIES: hypothetical protein [Clostridium]|uniref:Uncharacterized protein n=1 Tax=Clostridium lapidicellarium TaxID=3240931 RepID=A0ABV4DZP2_9CLOT